MGFLDGYKQIGEYFEGKDKNENDGDTDDIRNFLKYPLNLPIPGTNPDRLPKVIRIGLVVKDPFAKQLWLEGIREIALADYPGLEESVVKEKYLYKDPVGANVSWSFSPIYKLGASPGEAARSQLIGDGDAETETPILWHKDNKCRFFKLYSRVLKGFEDSGCFAEGSIDRLMQMLVERVDELAEKWQDKKRSYLLLFGVIHEDKFLFPGDLPAFKKHFRDKLNPGKQVITGGATCSLCGTPSSANDTLDKLFKFSTFDKVNFLPGLDKAADGKVFPVCKRCFALLARGITEVNERFGMQVGIPKVKIMVIPEIIGEGDLIKRTIPHSEAYLSSGVEQEEGLLERITRRDSSFLYHFLFIEQSQAQIILHRLVEDIPPTQFKKIKRLWESIWKMFFESDAPTLDKTARMIMAMILSLAGKSEIDKLVMKDRGFNVLAALFGNEWIDVSSLKQAVVGRLPGLFSDDEWLEENGGLKLRQLHCLFEFLYAANSSINTQEVEIP